MEPTFANDLLDLLYWSVMFISFALGSIKGGQR